MSEKIDTGGPAFPTAPEAMNAGSDGMTLRDWFAGQAMAGIVHAHGYPQPNEYASQAYAWADAMLAERAKGQK